MVNPAHPALLGIDWGTSNRRAYLLDRQGACIGRHADGEGMLAVGGNFAASLAALRRQMDVADDVPVLMSGMVGSASGWQEVPYLGIETPLERLPEHLVPVAGQARCAIVPGYRSQGAHVDVMRGEEVQLLGAVARGVRDGWVLLPGTHCKWVRMQAGRIAEFFTFMTGELFALLGQTGTLSAMLAPAPLDEAAFSAGLEAARRRLPLTHSLFGARARVVTGALSAGAARSYVSGLLIGSEFVQDRQCREASGNPAPLHIIGAPALSERYVVAARTFGFVPVVLDPDEVYIAALALFLNKGGDDATE